MVHPSRSSFFPRIADDDAQDDVNGIFWDALIARILEDQQGRRVSRVLDVGCHNGGLLQRLASELNPLELLGIEPLARAREIAARRLADAVDNVQILDIEGWPLIAGSSVDLITCHEVLYLVPSLDDMMASFARVLRRGGNVYAVLGCHSENPVWSQWSAQLRDQGLDVFTYSPFDVLDAASRAGMSPALMPLRRDGWIHYDPNAAEFAFKDAAAMLDHHYRHKLIFRFSK